jgi:hypothetical protein
LGKDKIIIEKIDHFYRELQDKKIDQQNIAKIRHLIENGKKKAVARVLISMLGVAGGKDLFETYKEYIR